MDDPPLKLGWLPKTVKDRLGLITVFLGVPICIAFELFYVFPHFYTSYHDGWPLLVWTLMITVNFYLNLIKLIVTDASGRNSQLPHILMPGWRYCYICHLNAPPRAYHCAICDRCILKRDSHFALAGKCVGYHNHRYYLMTLIYAWLGCTTALWLHWEFLWDKLGGLSIKTIVAVMFPQFAFILGLFDIVQMFLAGVQLFSIVAFSLISFLTAYQTFTVILRGQTVHEYENGVVGYNLGVWRNFLDVMGKNWLFAAVCPLIPSQLLGDGLKFQKPQDIENVKDM